MPFNKKLVSQLNNPYQRPFLLRALEIETVETAQFKYLTEYLPSLLIDLINGLGMYLIRPHLKKGAKAPALFSKKKKTEAKTESDNIQTVPDGKGGFIKVRLPR